MFTRIGKNKKFRANLSLDRTLPSIITFQDESTSFKYTSPPETFTMQACSQTCHVAIQQSTFCGGAGVTGGDSNARCIALAVTLADYVPSPGGIRCKLERRNAPRRLLDGDDDDDDDYVHLL